MTEYEFLKRYEAGNEFSERELREMRWDFPVESEHEGDDHRWTREITTVINVNGRFFRIDWRRGLTEMQDDEFWNQPVEVEKHEYEKTITVTEWLPVVKGGEKSDEKSK